MTINYNVLKSIIGSVFFKIASSLVSFISIPLLLAHLGKVDYGIWVTLTALVAWLNLFDFGSGYSLKNKVTESLVEEQKDNLNILIAGTIQFYLISTFVILVAFFISTFFISAFQDNFKLSLLIYLPIIFSFPFTVGHFILQGLKKFNVFNFILLSQTIIWLVIIYVINTFYSDLDIIALSFFYSFLYLIINGIIFFVSLKYIKFDWSFLLDFKNLARSKRNLKIGINFFLLQISSLILFSIGNLMTYDNLGPKDVSTFDTVNKIFIIGMTIFNVLISVYWSELSYAKALNDKTTLIKIYKTLLTSAGIFSFGTCILCLIIPWFMNLWTNGLIKVNLSQLYPFMFLSIVQFFSYSGAVILNAFEKLKGQVFFAIIASLMIIPLAKFFFSTELSIGSVPLASAIVLIPSLLFVNYKAVKCIKNI